VRNKGIESSPPVSGRISPSNHTHSELRCTRSSCPEQLSSLADAICLLWLRLRRSSPDTQTIRIKAVASREGRSPGHLRLGLLAPLQEGEIQLKPILR
jgi:hypothetical protein